MVAFLIAYARCSTDQQDLTAQRDGLIGLGVPANHIYGRCCMGASPRAAGLADALSSCPSIRIEVWLRWFPVPTGCDHDGRCAGTCAMHCLIERSKSC